MAKLSPCSRRKQTGLTLIEVSLVVAILGITAMSVLPNITPVDSTKLDVAASRLANALRFARNESIRTGTEHGVLIDHDDTEPASRDILVYQVSLSNPADFSHVLYHPVSKQPYDLRVHGPSILRHVTIGNSTGAFDMEGIGRIKFIHFDATGRPLYKQDAEQHRMLSGKVTLTRGSEQRSLSLDPVTGRVVIQ